MAHACPVPSCSSPAGSGRLACDQHWTELPELLRASFVRSLAKPSRYGHAVAAGACIEWLQREYSTTN